MPPPTLLPVHVIQRACRERIGGDRELVLILHAAAPDGGGAGSRIYAHQVHRRKQYGCRKQRHSFVEMADPFDSVKRIGAVKALNTDIAIVHALAADRNGNTIMSPVSQDTLWGSRWPAGAAWW